MTKKRPVACRGRWSVKQTSKQQLSVIRDHVTVPKPFSVVMGFRV